MANFKATGGDVVAESYTGNAVAVDWGRAAITMTDANYTVLAADYAKKILEVSGPLTAGRNVVLPLTDGAIFHVNNKTGQTLTFIGATGTGVAVATTKVAAIYCDGTNYVRLSADV